MTTEYRLDVYDTSGVLQAILTDFTSLAYVKTVNSPGLLRFGLNGEHALLDNLDDQWQFEIWRKPAGQAWARDFVGIYRQAEWDYADHSHFIATCPGIMDMLRWRIVAWTANTADRSKFTTTEAETIMKTLVSYNADASATVANGRIREGEITGMAVEADGANGNTLDWYCAYDNLLESLQKLALIAGGDFDLVKTSATAWEFRWYTGQLGTDRTATVKFSMELGNMAEPKYKEPRIEEKTVAIVGGQGTEADRDTVVRTGTNYKTSNNIEMFVNATDIDLGDTAALEDRGDQKLNVVEARNEFEFKALQIPSTLYGVHYYLGDLVTAINPFNADSMTLKVQSVAVSLNEDGSETIAPQFEVA